MSRSATGLTAAHSSPSATKPRGVLFFAGPTGVGKTELAKALTKLVFGDDNAYVRFDMSEFSAEQAADRLIGAPPGYVGFDAGGELTNAIRQQPFTVVLFDEIEKAHPRILDKFLQILDDGRLTDGRGNTVYFTETLIVFTSNLGIYVEEEHIDRAGIARTKRVPNVDHKTERSEMVTKVEGAIRDFFKLELNRPELLNRLGENIIVFDFIQQDAGEQILDLMIANVKERILTQHDIELTISNSALDTLRSTCLSEQTLELGGRGIGSRIETVLVNPLGSAIFLRDSDSKATKLVVEELRHNDRDAWTLVLDEKENR